MRLFSLKIKKAAILSPLFKSSSEHALGWPTLCTLISG